MTVRSGVSRDTLAKFDAEELFLSDQFCRWLFTILDSAGITLGYFQPEVACLAFSEGRRALGLDMLSDLAAKSGKSKEEVLQRILAVELKTQKEVQHASRNRDRHDRNRELGNGDDDVDGDTVD